MQKRVGESKMNYVILFGTWKWHTVIYLYHSTSNVTILKSANARGGNLNGTRYSKMV
ncbi:hypothetical protein TK11N_10720 [Tetragenococcus koreensis]|uniref:Uncharacterized protein n=1 Tax=Tetragenococcus koreensis TaxID=290335 RepID=A0AAN4UCE3_9ENTE|nr:hypothetical protein TKO01_17020 [Tetragenococcus koreensis]GEQ49220.1 hypothetical protein TK11N_10720 [Tetragenococcus koreensis]GEQ52348.1 hypothetical protein TK12N_16920 [Tetragenococcus koreensis]GEQ54864.1 hypothetical protein TK2N_17080 [Tetragenococcus koreensis]GEQ57349.1 hypothetical protein TK4N_16920 [Tetragenococcus koreensis]